MKTAITLSAVILFLFFLSGRANASAFPLLGGSLNLNMIINESSMTLRESADSIYLGTLDGKMYPGIGAEASLFYSIYPGLKAGPHFIFNYHGAKSTWHYFDIYQTSLGGIIDFNINDSNSVMAFVDYNLGWFSAEQTIATPAGSPSPAGSFSGGMPGLMMGVKTRTKITENIGLGIYYSIGMLTLTGIKYKNAANQNNWMNAEINYSQAGVTIYF